MIRSVSFNNTIIDRSACWLYRLDIPARSLKQRWSNVYVNQPHKADVQIFARTGQSTAVSFASALKQQGKTIVYDIDDDFWSIHPRNPYADKYPPSYVAGIETMIRQADVVTVSTERLAEVVRTKFPKKTIVVLPNCFDPSLIGKPMDIGLPKDRPVLLVSGGPSHASDFMVIPRIAERVKATWVTMVGKNEEGMVDGIRLGMRDFGAYLAALHALGGRVLGVVPLLDIPFNESKSRLKWLEYSWFGIPGIYSAIGEYRQAAHRTIRAGASVGEWADAILRAWEDRAKIAMFDQANAMEASIESNIHRWEEILE